MLHALVLRSPHAHATIRSIDTTAASSSTGVVSVVTALDLAEAVRNVPTRGNIDADVLKPPEHPVLAGDKVCYVGQLVAIVVAPEAALLVQELLNFQVKVTTAGNDTYGVWREGQHDDLVLATAVALWFGERVGDGFGIWL